MNLVKFRERLERLREKILRLIEKYAYNEWSDVKMKVRYVFLIIGIGFLLGGLMGTFFIPFPNEIIVSTNNTICFGCDDPGDPSLLIILAIMLPIVIVVGLLCLYLEPKDKEVESIEWTS